MLVGLYLVVKFLGKEWISWFLGWYFTIAGVGSVWKVWVILRSIGVVTHVYPAKSAQYRWLERPSGGNDGRNIQNSSFWFSKNHGVRGHDFIPIHDLTLLFHVPQRSSPSHWGRRQCSCFRWPSSRRSFTQPCREKTKAPYLQTSWHYHFLTTHCQSLSSTLSKLV